MPHNNKYNLVAKNPHLPAPQSVAARQAGSTVVAEYTPDKKRASHYQSEAELEARKKQYEYYRNKLLTFKSIIN